ncbi:mavicyanin-like [Lotus japonicus]|uniref:Phytocyanin domain-containing protein n=1 Tax=Lotus japonicus TaxID=34305 RepID=I3S2A6_LOTJA|nr:mavicyanin-like [Lotus japonicus]AFK34398.1 unknown [Lotus japonicus]
MAKTMVASLLVLLVAFPTVFGADHTVGDASGWNIGVDYTTWASGKTFKVGDNLVFTYSSSLHGVDEVDESSYKSCSTSSPIKTYSDGNTKVALTKAGTLYFICPTPGHCTSSGGMKVQIKVVAASSTTPSPTPTTPTPSTPTPTTPSPTTPSTTPSSPSESATPEAKSPSSPPKDSGAFTVSSGITLLVGSFITILGFMA